VFHQILADQHNGKLDRLHEGIHSSFGSESEITGFTVGPTNLPYLNAVIKATLCLYPPISDALRCDVPNSGPQSPSQIASYQQQPWCPCLVTALNP